MEQKMKKSIKLLSLFLSLVLLFALAGCNTVTGGDETSGSEGASAVQTVPVNAAVLKGPTAIGMVHLMEQNENKKSEVEYSFTVATAADQITAALLKGDLDIACLPTNAAATLYAKSGGKIQLCAINTLGVLYLMEKGETVKSAADLKGKTIVSAGKGSTPQFVLEHLLSSAGLTIGKDVTVIYATEHAEALTKLMSNQCDLALLPQPFATAAQNKSDQVRIALDCNQLWKDSHNGNELVMGSVVVRTEFAKEHPETVEAFLEEYAKSTAFANEQVAETAGLCGKYEIMEEAVAAKAIPKCAITFIVGDSMETMTDEFLKVLYGINPASVGEKLPDENFYWIAK